MIIQHNGKQYTVTIREDDIKRMGWGKGTEVYIAKDPNKEILYIEEMPKKIRRKNDLKRTKNK